MENGTKPAISIWFDHETMGVRMEFDVKQIPVGWDGVVMLLESAKRSAEWMLNVQRAQMLQEQAMRAQQEQVLRGKLKLG